MTKAHEAKLVGLVARKLDSRNLYDGEDTKRATVTDVLGALDRAGYRVTARPTPRRAPAGR